MILPSKHITMSNSLLNIGSTLLKNIDGQHSVTLLWDKTKNSPEIKTFEIFTLGLDMLYTLGLIEFKEGLIVRVAK